MAETSFAVEPGPAAVALGRFLDDNGIGVRDAARALKVSHAAVLGWVRGASKPTAPHRRAIEIWTNGAVVGDAWADEKELKREADLDAVKPFAPEPAKANGTDS